MQQHYGVETPLGRPLLILSSIQWFFFSVAMVIAMPIVLGHAFGMSPREIALFTDRTFFVSGVTGMLQAAFGHRFPVLEAPAGLWFAVLLALIGLTQNQGGSLVLLRQQLELGLIFAGAVFILIAGLRAISYVRSLFTPVVTGTFMVLLAFQVSKFVLRGILGIGYQGNTQVSVHILVPALAVVGLTIFLSVWGRGLARSMSILISLLVGWILFALLGMAPMPELSLPVLMAPQALPFGPAKFDLGVALTAVMTAIILLTAYTAALQAVSVVAREHPSHTAFNRGVLISGIGALLSGIFGTVGLVPNATSSSLIHITRVATRLPFVLSAAAIAALGLFPRLGAVASALPQPVAYAVLFPVFAQLLSFGLQEYRRLKLDERDLLIISLSLVTGVGLLFVPGAAWLSIPPVLSYVLDNGLIVGVLMVLALEHLVLRRRFGPEDERTP